MEVMTSLIATFDQESETVNRSRRTQVLPAVPSKERASCLSSVSCGFSTNSYGGGISSRMFDVKKLCQ
jgi:hypothetical protein